MPSQSCGGIFDLAVGKGERESGGGRWAEKGGPVVAEWEGIPYN